MQDAIVLVREGGEMIPASIMDLHTLKMGLQDRPKYERMLKDRNVPTPEEPESELLAQRKVLVVSFYTPDYTEAAKRLIGTLDRFGIPHDIEEVPKPSGDAKTAWYDSETDKASFLIRKLKEHPEYETLVWLDADGELMRFPRIFWNVPRDLGFHYHGFKEPISSTLVVHHSTVPLLEEWAVESKTAFKNRLKCPSQKALKVVLGRKRMEWVQLPGAYALLWRWNSRDRAEADGVFIHERWNRNAKIPTKDKNGKKIRESKRKGMMK